MSRSLLTRVLRVWRAGEHTLWPDVALAAALSLATAWFAVRTGTDMPGDGDVPLGGPLPPLPPDVLIRHEGGPDWSDIVRNLTANVLVTASLVVRRRWPLACFAAQFGILVGLGPEGNVASLAAILIGAYSLAVYRRSALVSLGTLLVAATVTVAVETNTWPRLPGWAGIFALLMPVGLTGVAIRAARSRARASDERAEALRREQEAATRLAVAQERARIARELHDVVSHHVSVMTIQAGAAGKVLDAQPELARGALSAIEASGRETMTELRHLLGVLNPSPADDLLRPQPGLDQLDALVEKVRQAGQPVSVRRTPVALPRGVELTAYRVVQEALTNALRYAPGARTDIAITTVDEGTDLVIEVTNDAPPPDARPGPHSGSGTGLLGLAERLRLYGGTLETGRRVGGGFRLLARMPLAAAR